MNIENKPTTTIILEAEKVPAQQVAVNEPAYIDDNPDDLDEPGTIYAQMDGVEYVAYINRMLLKKIRLAIQRAPSLAAKNLEASEKDKGYDMIYDRVFGKDCCLFDALADVANLALKIDKQRPKIELPDQEVYAVRFDDEDIALVQHYIARNSKDD